MVETTVETVRNFVSSVANVVRNKVTGSSSNSWNRGGGWSSVPTSEVGCGADKLGVNEYVLVPGVTGQLAHPRARAGLRRGAHGGYRLFRRR